MEILAPAGSPEALKAAVFSGADAVYLGGPAFGARANAKNFTMEELSAAVEFCHARGVRVHVTVNTLLKDHELPAALRLVEALCQMAVDAVLVQDMGLFSLLRSLAPDLPLHASTQMSLHTPGGAAYLQRLGARRVVLSRELSLSELEEVSRATDVELEAFVHGALCMSVSGQCYFSAMLGGRSGNRGQCAQPCRLPFAAKGGTGHDLSLKDLSFIREIKRLEQAGVCSAKIEGRMKRPEYVAAAVAACRRAADGETPPRELLENLEAVFSRSGFTDGYLTARRGREMFGVRTKEDVTGATEKVFSALRGLYRKERQSVPVKLALTQKDGRLILRAEDEDGNAVEAAAEADAALSPLSKERCEAQLRKTGGTPFLVRGAAVPANGARTGVSQLNALRREALDVLLAKRGRRAPIPFASGEYRPTPRESLQKKSGMPPLRVHFRSPEQVPEQLFPCESIVLPLGTPPTELEALRERGYSRILLEQPRAFFGVEGQVAALMEEAVHAGFSEFVCQNLGGLAIALKIAESVPVRLHGGFGLNLFNTAALDFFAAQGLASAELSFELSGREMARLGGVLPRGAMVYGRQALMLTRNCPLANSPRGCLNCKEPGCLTDRMRKRFPVLCTGRGQGRYSEVFNSVPLWLGDRQAELEALDFTVCRFTVEDAPQCAEVLTCLLEGRAPGFDYTRGLFARGVESAGFEGKQRNRSI